ncbi:MAG: Mbeg1-like protein, partial [Lachnospiraceae bacterium]
MASLSDYLTWRGDITFDEVPLNAVDALLLSQISYLDLKGIIGDGEEQQECTLAYASKRYWELHTQKELEHCVSFALRTAGILLREMAQTKRFASLILRNYVSRTDVAAEEQFAAVELVLGKRESYISYRGTD